jgi:hypothetical protein
MATDYVRVYEQLAQQQGTPVRHDDIERNDDKEGLAIGRADSL